MSDEHDELRARLRAADPASSLPRPDPDRVARLLEDTMSHPQTPESGADGTRQRSPLTWLAAAAAVVIIAGVRRLRGHEPHPGFRSACRRARADRLDECRQHHRAARARGRGDLGSLPGAERGGAGAARTSPSTAPSRRSRVTS